MEEITTATSVLYAGSRKLTTNLWTQTCGRRECRAVSMSTSFRLFHMGILPKEAVSRSTRATAIRLTFLDIAPDADIIRPPDPAFWDLEKNRWRVVHPWIPFLWLWGVNRFNLIHPSLSEGDWIWISVCHVEMSIILVSDQVSDGRRAHFQDVNANRCGSVKLCLFRYPHFRSRMGWDVPLLILRYTIVSY